MCGTAMDSDGAQWGLKGWCVECVGQSNKLSANVANNGAAAKTRNWNVVGQDYEATRSGSMLHK